MKISGVRIRATSPLSPRYRQWATLMSIKILDDKAQYKCMYEDGSISYIPAKNTYDYEISRCNVK